MDLIKTFQHIRNHTKQLCAPLQTEDYVVQPIVDVSPPKWHLGHTTWFFETFLLLPFANDYEVYNPDYDYVFNSYYETVGARVIRTDRGNLSRPTVGEVYAFRAYVDEAMLRYLQQDITAREKEIILLGFNHEQQHQELLMTDIKYILGNNPLMPAYKTGPGSGASLDTPELTFISCPAGVYETGYAGEGFCFDNELDRHKVYLEDFSIASRPVTNGEYLEFMQDGGYTRFNHWHADGWAWVNSHRIRSPQYWHEIDGAWQHYTLQGLQDLDFEEPVCHVSYYEAAAYAAWHGMRLPTEAEWEVMSGRFRWGRRWEWTESAYLPYPGFKKAPGAIGEYNGKFMVNQMVLRGASDVTPEGHSRASYRNFFQPDLRWQYTGIRLAK